MLIIVIIPKSVQRSLNYKSNVALSLCVLDLGFFPEDGMTLRLLYICEFSSSSLSLEIEAGCCITPGKASENPVFTFELLSNFFSSGT